MMVMTMWMGMAMMMMMLKISVFTYMELAEGVAELVGGDVGRESSLLAWWDIETWSSWWSLLLIHNQVQSFPMGEWYLSLVKTYITL